MQVSDSRGFFVRMLQGEACRPARLIRTLLAPASWLYGRATRIRRRAYGAGILPVYRAGAPVISVGNLTTGGTGKTPMVEWLVRRLLRNGRRAAILSRGYRAPSSPGTGTAGKNDEALLLEKLLPDVPHYADPDRARSARRAVEAGADCLVLDDGFQHLRVHRDVDLVLLDATCPFGGGRVLPAGSLREPLSVLRASDAVILTRTDAMTDAERRDLRVRVRGLAGDKPVFEAVHRPERLLALDGKAVDPPEKIAGRRVGVFCGIGNPVGFLRTVEGLGAEIVSAHFLPDHCAYDERVLGRIATLCGKDGAEMVVTTEKDAVKIGSAVPWPGTVPLRVLRIEIAFTVGREELEAMLEEMLARWHT